MAARKSLFANFVTRYLYLHIKKLILLVCFPAFDSNELKNTVKKTRNIVTVTLKGVPRGTSQPVEKRPVWLHNQTGHKVNEG